MSQKSRQDFFFVSPGHENLSRQLSKEDLSWFCWPWKFLLSKRKFWPPETSKLLLSCIPSSTHLAALWLSIIAGRERRRFYFELHKGKEGPCYVPTCIHLRVLISISYNIADVSRDRETALRERLTDELLTCRKWAWQLSHGTRDRGGEGAVPKARSSDVTNVCRVDCIAELQWNTYKNRG